MILRQVEQARQDVADQVSAPSGRVHRHRPLSMASSLTPQIVSEVGRRYPDIVCTHRDLRWRPQRGHQERPAGHGPHLWSRDRSGGSQFTTMIVEDLHLVVNASRSTGLELEGGGGLLWKRRHGTGFFCRSRTIRSASSSSPAFKVKGLQLRLVGEIESVPSLARLLRADLGATVLPQSAADALFHEEDFPRAGGLLILNCSAKIALCTPDHEPLSEAASAVLLVLKEMLHEMLSSKYARRRGVTTP